MWYTTQLEVKALLEKEKTKIDNKSIIKNNNNEINVPFDNNTIYYENGVWKSKQGGDIPSDVIKDSDLNKDYIYKQDGKYIVKTAKDLLSNYYDANAIDNFLVNKQVKLIAKSSLDIDYINCGRYVSCKDAYVYGYLSFHNEATPENAPRFTKAVRVVQNNTSGNDWEEVDTSDFIPNTVSEYKIKNFDKSKYVYKVWANTSGYALLMAESFKNYNEDIAIDYFYTTSQFILFISKNGSVITWLHGSDEKISSLHIERKKVI